MEPPPPSYEEASGHQRPSPPDPPSPPHERFGPPAAARHRTNLYCLKYVFCGVLMWVLAANAILFWVLPAEVEVIERRTQRRDEASEVSFATLEEVLQRFLDAAREAGLDKALVLVQPEVLEGLEGFSWARFAKRRRRLLSFALAWDADLPRLEGLAERAAFSLYQRDGRHALLTSQALIIHIATFSATKEGLLSTEFPLLHDGSKEALSRLGVYKDNGELLFLRQKASLPPHALDRLQRDVDGVTMRIPAHVQDFLRELNYSSSLSCDREGAAAFHAEHPQEEAPAYKRAVRSILHRAAGALHQLRVPFWLSSGTALGWARQCGVIPYAGDVDFGLFAHQAPHHEEIIDALEAEGFQLKMLLGRPSDSLQLAFFLDDVKLDLYFFYPHSQTPDTFYNAATKPETGELYWYSFPLFRLCWADHVGEDFPKDTALRVPCPIEPYLEANYGPNWRSPVRSWDWRLSPPNAAQRPSWTKAEMATTVQVFDHHSPSLMVDKEL